jgi:hypothetical protein
MKLAVIGSRTFNNYITLKIVIDDLCDAFNIDTIVSGGAKGADRLAEVYADEHHLKLDVYPADWDKHGRAAGYIRNNFIWDNADMGVAFWDGQSKGTAHSFDISKKQSKPLYVFNYTVIDFYLYSVNAENPIIF